MLRPFKIWTFCYASPSICTSPPFFRFSVENVEVSFLLWSLRSAICHLLIFTYSQILIMVKSLKDASDNFVFYCYLPWQNLLVANQLSTPVWPLWDVCYKVIPDTSRSLLDSFLIVSQQMSLKVTSCWGPPGEPRWMARECLAFFAFFLLPILSIIDSPMTSPV